MDNREDMIMVRSEELKRYQIIGKVFDKSINQQEAAELLGLSCNKNRRRPIREVCSRISPEWVKTNKGLYNRIKNFVDISSIFGDNLNHEIH